MSIFYTVNVYRGFNPQPYQFEIDNETGENEGFGRGPDPIAKVLTLVEAIKADAMVKRITWAKTDNQVFGKPVGEWNRE